MCTVRLCGTYVIQRHRDVNVTAREAEAVTRGAKHSEGSRRELAPDVRLQRVANSLSVLVVRL